MERVFMDSEAKPVAVFVRGVYAQGGYGAGRRILLQAPGSRGEGGTAGFFVEEEEVHGAISGEVASEDAFSIVESVRLPELFYIKPGARSIAVRWEKQKAQEIAFEVVGGQGRAQELEQQEEQQEEQIVREYRVAEQGGQWVPMEGAPPYIIGGLEPSTVYSLSWRIIYPEGASQESSLQVKTLPDAPQSSSSLAPALHYPRLALELGTHHITLAWRMVVDWPYRDLFEYRLFPASHRKQVEAGEMGVGEYPWVQGEVGQAEQIHGLWPNASYIFQFRLLGRAGTHSPMRTVSVHTRDDS